MSFWGSGCSVQVWEAANAFGGLLAGEGKGGGMTKLSEVEKRSLMSNTRSAPGVFAIPALTDAKSRLPGCPFSISVHTGKCPEIPWQPEPRKRLDVGTLMVVTFEWPAADNWLAHASERLAGLLYRIGIRWPNRWGQWRLVILETEGEVIRDNETGLEWCVTPGIRTQGPRGSFAEIEGLDGRP